MMKITKFFMSVFLLTFFVGLIGYFLTPREAKKIQQYETVQLVSQNNSPKSEIDIKPNVYNVENFWDDSQGEYNKNLLEVGDVSNGEDISAKSGETWLGLFYENGKDVLRSTKIKVKTTKGEEEVSKEISVSDKLEPMFLLKNKNKFKTGEVKTLFREKTWKETDDYNNATEIKDGFNKRFNLGNAEYTLRVEKGISTKQEPILILFLETANTSQIVHFIYYVGEGDYVGNLYWIGDIDNDGKLDLYMEFYGYEKGGYSTGLFLSSEAEKGKLVKKSEYFMLGGC